jgi:hypothetical protein
MCGSAESYLQAKTAAYHYLELVVMDCARSIVPFLIFVINPRLGRDLAISLVQDSDSKVFAFPIYLFMMFSVN